jgi:hypothetical protein
MKKFTVPCYFNGVKAPFTIYIGAPEDQHHPLHFQADWLQKERGGTIPSEVMDSIAKLKALADKNNVSFEDLCVYALGAAQQDDEPTDESEPDAEPTPVAIEEPEEEDDYPTAPSASFAEPEEEPIEEVEYEATIEEELPYPALDNESTDDEDDLNEEDTVEEEEEKSPPKKPTKRKKKSE